jgi:ferritin
VVIGKYHREVVTRLDARAEKDTETIALLSRAVTERAAEDQAMTRILNAIRTASSDKGGVT